MADNTVNPDRDRTPYSQRPEGRRPETERDRIFREKARAARAAEREAQGATERPSRDRYRDGRPTEYQGARERATQDGTGRSTRDGHIDRRAPRRTDHEAASQGLTGRSFENERPERHGGNRGASRPRRDERVAAKREPRARPGDAVQPARRVAFEVLQAVRHDDAYANLLLPSAIRRAGLSHADAGLATELCYGSLRMQGYYDRVIELSSGRGVADIDPDILDVLRLGAHQLLSTRVATHAAVNESVSLAREVGSRSATGFVNGVLRGITRTTPADWAAQVAAAAGSEDERLSALHSHPTWIVRAFRQALRAEGRVEELEDLLEANNAAPQVTYIALPGQVNMPAEAQPAPYSPLAFHLSGGEPEIVISAHHGLVRVQDEGSQLAALTLTRMAPVAEGEVWQDLCAGPGGKAVLLGAEALAGGATLTANEIVPARAELVRKALAVLPEHFPVVENDAREWGALFPESADRILVDAPCTGLGALRRRPEARWRKTAKDLADLGVIQVDALNSAIAALKPGATVAYVTCSPHIAETRGVVSNALRVHEDLELLDTAAILQSLSNEPLDLGEGLVHGDGTTVQLWPHRHGTDAMFIALLRRRA